MQAPLNYEIIQKILKPFFFLMNLLKFFRKNKFNSSKLKIFKK